MHYRIEDEFETTCARYWEVFFDEAYNQALFAALEVDYQLLVLARRGEGPALEIERRMRLVPRRAMPALMRRFVGDAIAYEERDLYRARSGEMDVVTTPVTLADKVTTRGRYFLEERGPGRICRIWDAECSVHIPLLGRRIEELVIADVRETYGKATAFTRTWLARDVPPR
jgi:hypothetical protein